MTATPETSNTDDDRRILAGAPIDSDDWDDATWAAWWRAAERAHGKVRQNLHDTELIRDFNQNSARHLADKRDVVEEALTEWEAGRLSPETALKMIRAALAVGEVKTLAELRKETPDDPRFPCRIYIDGEGDPWIEVPMSPDNGRVHIVQLRQDAHEVVDAEEIRANTGGLREIGRCA